MPDQLEYLIKQVKSLPLRDQRIEISAELHGALKLICKIMGISLRSFVAKVLTAAVNSYSDKLEYPILDKMKELKEERDNAAVQKNEE